MPAGTLVTAPWPFPVRVTVRVCCTSVVKVQVGPVVVLLPSRTVTYHSYFVSGVRPGQPVLVLEPEGTSLFVPIHWKAGGEVMV